jgi:hypothetical protein
MIEIPLRLKYRSFKPKGKNRANYGGNSGKSTPKGNPPPVGLRKRSKRKSWSR